MNLPMTTLVQTSLMSLGYISKTRIVDCEYKHTKLLHVVLDFLQKSCHLAHLPGVINVPIFLLTNLIFLILSRLDVIIQDTWPYRLNFFLHSFQREPLTWNLESAFWRQSTRASSCSQHATLSLCTEIIPISSRRIYQESSCCAHY